jgi:hypothetical protein
MVHLPALIRKGFVVPLCRFGFQLHLHFDRPRDLNAHENKVSLPVSASRDFRNSHEETLYREQAKCPNFKIYFTVG